VCFQGKVQLDLNFVVHTNHAKIRQLAHIIFYIPQYYGDVRYKTVKIVILDKLLSITAVT